MSATRAEVTYAYERGRAARRGCQKIGVCPYRGKTTKIETLAEEWRRGWTDEDAARKAKAAQA